MVIVLITTGKHESVDTAKVILCATREIANTVIVANTSSGKYWSNAQIVDDNEEIELYQPDHCKIQ